MGKALQQLQGRSGSRRINCAAMIIQDGNCDFAAKLLLQNLGSAEYTHLQIHHTAVPLSWQAWMSMHSHSEKTAVRASGDMNLSPLLLLEQEIVIQGSAPQHSMRSVMASARIPESLATQVAKGDVALVPGIALQQNTAELIRFVFASLPTNPPPLLLSLSPLTGS